MTNGERLLGTAVVACLLSASTTTLLAQGGLSVAPGWRISEEAHRAQARPSSEPRFLPASWVHGYWVSIVTHDYDSTKPDEVNVVLADSNGTRVRGVRVWLPGSIRVNIDDVVVVDDAGTLLASGYAVASERGIVYFIARVDANGAVADVIKTNPFVPSCVCPAPDGTIWALGQELGKSELHEDYMMLRQYAFGTGLVAQYLPRNSFRSDVSPGAVVASAESLRGFGQASYLRCAKDRVVVYVNLTDELAEIDSASHAVTRYSVDMSGLSGDKVKGLALSDEGRIFAGLSEGWGANPGGLTGLYELRADPTRRRAHWIPVEGTVTTIGEASRIPAGTFIRLLGHEGDNLIVERADMGLSSVRLVPVGATAQ